MSVANSFTKEKLKAELKKINIIAPKDARKDVYIQLYEKHILQMGDRAPLELSSDEESVGQTPSIKTGRLSNKVFICLHTCLLYDRRRIVL